MRAAGRLGIPFTSGILIGIGETRAERIDALLALRDLHDRHGHLQDLIIQNFCAKPGTRMANAPEPTLDEQLWTIAVARLLFGASMSIQAPPNLRPQALERLADSGINDWGGLSPVTPDDVNPEAPWPELQALALATAASGRELVERLAITPSYARDPARWVDSSLQSRVLRMTDATGLARTDGWYAGAAAGIPAEAAAWFDSRAEATGPVARALASVVNGEPLAEQEVLRAAVGARRGLSGRAVCSRRTAPPQRRRHGELRRQLQHQLHECLHAGVRLLCFFEGPLGTQPAGPGLPARHRCCRGRAVEAWRRGATEVCLQGGIHPSFTGRTYLDIVAAVREAVPEMHVHAFSPLEIQHGATTLGLTLEDYLGRLGRAGLGSLPGTAAEILDDSVRARICPEKLESAEWLEVMGTAHRCGLRSTATMMFGHVDSLEHWARHLLSLRRLQQETGGFTEFVPLPFVHPEAPLWRRGLARSGPTFRETLLVHAVARIVLHPVFRHVQASWVKMGADGVAAALRAGADDMGGVLMHESITRAAGGAHGQEMSAESLMDIALSLGRRPWQRSTLYRPAIARAVPVGGCRCARRASA